MPLKMRKLPLFLIFVLLFSAYAQGQISELPVGAEKVCGRLFEMLDQGRLRETYGLTGPVARQTENESSWYGQMSSERESMGDVVSRRLSRIEKVDTFADLPRGDYLMVVYETSFATHPESREIVVLDARDAGGFELAAYRVRYDMWPEAVTIIGNGLLIVFLIMALLATITWAVGKLMQVTSKPDVSEKDDKEKEKG
jgi:hypothetical protein